MVERLSTVCAKSPPPVTDHFIDLPLTTLHYVRSGEGPPLIMVPATASRIDHWVGLAQFFGQKFTTYFFELPGHGRSAPFPGPYSSDLVAQTVGHMVDALGFSTFTLMGFSFGGLLTLKTLALLEERIERIVLLAPCVSHRALTFSNTRKWILKRVVLLVRRPAIRKAITDALRHPRYQQPVTSAIRFVGRVEETVPLDDRLHLLSSSTLDVLTYQIEEVLHLEFPPRAEPCRIPLHFGMSVNDTLLDFTTTYNFIDSNFADVRAKVFTFPYHQPRDIPTFEVLQQEFSGFLDHM